MYYKTIKISLFFYFSFTNYKHIIFSNLNTQKYLHKKSRSFEAAFLFDNRGLSIYLLFKNSSTFAAHSLPSLIAQTTSDCPRRISPAVNIFCWFV